MRMAPQLTWRSLTLALLCVVLLRAEGSLAGGGCRARGKCSCLLHKSTHLTRLMAKQAEDLLTTYIASQGDFSDLFCKLPVSDVPRAEIVGQGTLERLRSVCATLGLFRHHVVVVTEEQENLQDPENPLLARLQGTQTYITNLAASIAAVLQTLHPNEPTEAAAPHPYAPGHARNVFQQKIYGCAVLTGHRDFLLHVLLELKDLRANGHACMSRT
ncbi:hypothetical protein AAFF_G00054440 [Aldrovandia affinis]|uniref:Ciliary neurotrophic factor n=1 Tax=Aldrovandia affinis TaxID=143900 RepID=A0AAD7WEA0_9TELE|nr:hypothetical protein AAFF_G00054440 [Aldrovandia affinis]